MATKSLGLPQDPRAAVFRRIVTQLRNDPLLRRVVGDEWFVWDGSRDDEADFASGQGVAIRLTPRVGAGEWLDETGQDFPLVVVVEALVPGTDADDPLNLQGAIERALYLPSDRAASQAFSKALMDLGATTGTISFLPLVDVGGRDRQDGTWALMGQFHIDVRRTFNP